MALNSNSSARAAHRGSLQAPHAKASVDIATLAGLSIAFLLVIAAIILGGSPDAFFDIKAVFIVIGGTFGVVTACFSFRDMSSAFKTVAQAVFHLPVIRLKRRCTYFRLLKLRAAKAY